MGSRGPNTEGGEHSLKVLKSLENPTVEQVYLEGQKPMERVYGGAHEEEINVRRNECQEGTVMDRPLPPISHTHCCGEGQGGGRGDMNETVKLILGRKGEGKVLLEFLFSSDYLIIF